MNDKKCFCLICLLVAALLFMTHLAVSGVVAAEEITPPANETFLKLLEQHGYKLDQHGRPVQIKPAPGYEVPGQYEPHNKIIKKDAYGPGVHMDQYGRPVHIKP